MTRLYLALILGFVLCATPAVQAKPNSVAMDMLKISVGTFLMGNSTCQVEVKVTTRLCAMSPPCPKDDLFTSVDESAGCTGKEVCEDKTVTQTHHWRRYKELLAASKTADAATEHSIGWVVKTGLTDECPPERVTLRKPFFLSATEVTQKQWATVMGKNPSNFQSDKLGYRSENNPVEQVSWFDAIKFANALSKKEGLPTCYNDKGTVIGGPTVYACKGYRLPTEAEWEYAARAGTKGERYGKLDDIAWYDKNSGKKTHPVGKKTPNGFGLYDMLGNVWEWCHDWYDDYPKGSQTNPQGPRVGSYRVFRGGSWSAYAAYVRAAGRRGDDPSGAYVSYGFRLARSAP